MTKILIIFSFQLFPRWIAPNVLTVTGFFLIVINAGLLSYYDYDFSASSDTIKSTQPIPNWVWLVCAINHFFSHNLDGIDGKCLSFKIKILNFESVFK